jgi:selenobiotic family peptide radical SAM maturase
MKQTKTDDLTAVYSLTASHLGREAWHTVLRTTRANSVDEIPSALKKAAEVYPLPDFIPSVAEIELARKTASAIPPAEPGDHWQINPSVQILDLPYSCAGFFNEDNTEASYPPPVREPEKVVVWNQRGCAATQVRRADDAVLLALKIIAEDVSPEAAAQQAGVSIGVIDRAMQHASKLGIVTAPASKLVRTDTAFPITPEVPSEFTSSDTFTIQWHITQACDLNCKHCYDRSKRSPLTLEQGTDILEQLHDFCRSSNVSGHVCLTGGNPLLYPRFYELYEKAAALGFSTSILGNPCSREELERILDIQMPAYYQVSLEGLEEHNDDIRGKGHYLRVIEFLGLLRDVDVSSAVMLTLTSDNIDQVIPLGERLRGHTDYFTFNRLSQVGQGASLNLPGKETYAAFLQDYMKEAENNPILGFKDNLISIIKEKKGLQQKGGCTGYGCGAAFSFVAILPNGEIHACRKFPSPIGNVIESRLEDIYNSAEAQRYRDGAQNCRLCRLRYTCGGCMAITSSTGGDPFRDTDPFCFVEPHQ